ncbi:hypothetical protein OVN20_03240 [Microcella daejeonensis]|uniref:hypothetical protein n=1 Tax=Microcella daejeonensis TaxID=2994971 RepID=UPI0022703C7D|nr:hypothetical protein [Microcella daejeonensis]WAB84597.1 hypothetical protein OVN20_03240 [Microcella daejeonensis]
MSALLPRTGLRLVVGGLSREALRAALHSQHVDLNAYALRLLGDSVFDDGGREEEIIVVERTVAELDLPDGAPIAEIVAAADAAGLLLCPPVTGPYLRLALSDQPSAPDSVLSAGMAPTGSLTVASPALHDDAELPRGFYLRVVDGQAWLRGYRCDDDYRWSGTDRFVFRTDTVPE